MSLWGGLTLQRAVAAARSTRPTPPIDHLARAREMAERLGEGRNDFNTDSARRTSPCTRSRWPSNSATPAAPSESPTVDTSGLSGERRARLHIDVARAHAQRRQVDEAVAALRTAESITPEQVHNHRVVRRLVADLLTMQSPPSAELRELAERVGA